MLNVKGRIVLLNKQIENWLNSLDDKTRIFERTKKTSFEEGEVLIHKPKGARFDLFGI